MKRIIKFVISLLIYIYVIYVICKFTLFATVTLVSTSWPSNYLKVVLDKISNFYLDIKIIIVKVILKVITLIKYVIDKIF